MTKVIAMMLGTIVAGLIAPSVVHAQNVIAIQGTIQAADCQANTLTLKAADGSARVLSTASSTAVFVNSAATSLCTLPQYVGNGAKVWITASGDKLLAGRVDVSVVAAPVIPESVPSYGDGPYYGPSYGPYYAPYGPYYQPYYYPFYYRRDRDFHNDRDFHHDRDFHGGDRGGSQGSGNGGSQGGGTNGGPHGGGMNGGPHGGGTNGGPHDGGTNGNPHGGGMNGGPHGGGGNVIRDAGNHQK
jgi:hypothetical protein